MQIISSLPWVTPLLGGVLIGLASWLLLASLGRVAGISGIAAAAISPSEEEKAGGSDGAWRKMFLTGLIGGGALAFALLSPPATGLRSAPLLIAAGLLVGAGTVLGSGCTSGHGVCGLGRRSVRSLVATLTFMAFGVLTVIAINFIAARA